MLGPFLITPGTLGPDHEREIMNISNIIHLVLWAAALGLVVIYGTRIAGSVANRVRV
jgi:hypothetical protein